VSKPQSDLQMCQRMRGANRAMSFVLAGEELRDLVTHPAGLNTYRSHPAVYFPMQRRGLWKFYNSAGLHLDHQS
jgi:hypothetical protein